MTEHSIDPAIAEAVQAVSNRFGVLGLQEMIEAARVELERARAALAQLAADSEADRGPDAGPDAGADAGPEGGEHRG